MLFLHLDGPSSGMRRLAWATLCMPLLRCSPPRSARLGLGHTSRRGVDCEANLFQFVSAETAKLSEFLLSLRYPSPGPLTSSNPCWPAQTLTCDLNMRSISGWVCLAAVTSPPAPLVPAPKISLQEIHHARHDGRGRRVGRRGTEGSRDVIFSQKHLWQLC